MTLWIIQTLVATTLLMLVVLLLRRKITALFGASIAYALWLLPALRMILPPLPQMHLPQALAHLPIALQAPVSAVSAVSAVSTPVASLAMPAATAADTTAHMSWLAVLLAVWLAGALLHLAWSLLIYRRFARQVLATATPVPALARSMGIATRITTRITVVSSPAVDGPLAMGLVMPVIVLPSDHAGRYAPDELDFVMLHETVHHRRGDLYWNLAALVMLSLHWFNPIAWRAYRAFRADQELACDARVLAGRGARDRQAYGAAVVKSACNRSPLTVCTLHRKDQLKRRLKMMGQVAKSRRVRASGVVLAALLVGSGLVLTASGGVAAESAALPALPAAQAHAASPAPQVHVSAPSRPAGPDENFDVSIPDIGAVAAQSPAVPAPPAPPAPAAHPAPQVHVRAPSRPARPGRNFSDENVNVSIPDIGAIVERSVAQAMASIDRAMASVNHAASSAAAKAHTDYAKCEAEGGDRNAVLKRCYGVDMHKIRDQVLAGLEEARDGLKSEADLSDAQRDKAVQSIDRAITRFKNDPRWSR